MDNLVSRSLSMKLFNFKSKVAKRAELGRISLSYSSFQICLANTPIEYASAAFKYNDFFFITSNKLLEPCGLKT
jgi:hypothetical protein